MLAQFSVENYMSFKDRTCLNMSASATDNEHPDNFAVCGKTRCLKSVVIYGANASGKSNLLKAMTAAIMIVRESQAKQVNDRLMRIVPFLFDKELAGLDVQHHRLAVVAAFHGLLHVGGIALEAYAVAIVVLAGALPEHLLHIVAAGEERTFVVEVDQVGIPVGGTLTGKEGRMPAS